MAYLGILNGLRPTASGLASWLTVLALVLPSAPQSEAAQPAPHGPATAGLVVEDMVQDTGCAAAPDIALSDCGDANCRFTSLWGSADYLVLWEQGRSIPVLATTSVAGTSRANAGIEGLSTTQNLFGGDRIDDTRLGGRLTFGLWWDRAANTGIGFSYLGVGKSTIRFDGNSTQFPILARPFFNALNNQEDALLLAFPGAFTGNIAIQSTSELNAAEVFKRQCCRRGDNYRLDILVGYRYSQLRESLRIESSNLNTATNQSISNMDQFSVDNTFHAGQLGIWSQSRSGNFSLDLIAKLAMGQMTFDANTQGQTVVTSPNAAATTLTGGLLTQASNLGNFKDSVFGVMPEFTTSIGYQINPYIDLTIGYTWLYWSRIMHPGNLIDRTIDLSQQAGSPTAQPRPALAFHDTDYWMQGLTFGINFRY